MRIKERDHQPFLNSKAFLVFLIFLFLVLSFYTYETFYKKYQIKKEISILNSQINELKSKKEELQNTKNILTNEDYIEREARLKLNFKKEGEEVVVLVDKPYASNEKESVEQVKIEENKNKISGKENFKKWVKVIFGN